MSTVFLLARIYPYWALALVLVLFQLFVFYKRRKHPLRFSVLGMMVFLVIGIFAWFIFRGDLNSDDWVRSLIGR
jgi:TctA family transporter